MSDVPTDADHLYTLVDEADDLLEEGKSGHALAIYSEVVAKGSGSTDSNVREAVAEALYGKGSIHYDTGLFDSAVQSLTRLLTEFDETWFEEIEREQLRGRALLKRAAAYSDLERYGDALADIHIFIERHWEKASIADRVVALARMATTLALAERYEEALVAYERAMEVAGAEHSDDLRPMEAVLACGRAESLKQLGRIGESRVAYEEVIRRFGDLEGRGVELARELLENPDAETR